MKKENEMSDRMWQLDYLKAVAIIFVILLHSTWTEAQRACIFFPYGINLAVPVFMYVSGYVNMRSYERRTTDTIVDWIRERLIKQVMQLYLPFIFPFCLELWYMCVYKNLSVTFLGAMKLFLLGGFGPGSYYVSILLQFAMVFPILFYIVKKNEKWGAVVIILVQLCLEIVSTMMDLPDSIYRVLLFRYFVFILLGMLFYKHSHIAKSVLLLLTALGAAYIYIISYGGYTPVIFKNWTDTSMPTVLWLAALMYPVIHYMKSLPGIIGNIVSTIGKSTYYIFMVQKLFFIIGESHVTKSNLLNAIIIVFLSCIAGVGWKLIFEKFKTVLRYE